MKKLMIPQKQRLRRIQCLIELKAPDAIVEHELIAYLETEYGGGWRLINYLLNKLRTDWIEDKAFIFSYWLNVCFRKQSERAFLANRAGLTEAEVALIENENEV